MKEKLPSIQNGVEVEEQIKLSGHKWHISSLAFSVNGVYFASGSWDKQIRIWDLRVLTTSNPLGEEENGHQAPVTSISWFPNIEFLLASGSADNTVRIWNSETGERLAILQEHTGWVLGTSFNHNGNILASASWDKSIGIWDINTLKLSQTLQGHSEGIWKAVFRTFDGDNVLCSASEDSSLKIWDLRTQSKWLAISNLVGIHDDAVKCCAWSPCGNYIAAGSVDSKISVWDVRENRAVNVLYGHSEMVTDLKFLPMQTSNGNEVLASVGDTTCRFWDVLSSQKAKQLHSISQHDLDYEVECLEVSLDGTLLATGGRDNKIVLSTLNVSEEELHKFNNSQKSFAAKESGIKRSNRASGKSSALLVDNTVHQNELLESEKAKQIAKQTVKIKNSGKSDVLQSKLLELKSSKSLPADGRLEEGSPVVSPKVEAPSASNATKKPPFVIPDKDYEISGNSTEQTLGQQEHKKDKENPSKKENNQQNEPKHNKQNPQVDRERQQLQHNIQKEAVYDNSDSLYQNGLILSSVRNPQRSHLENPGTGNNNRPGSTTTLDSSYDIDDVANELIRLSEEQQSYDARL